MALTAFSIASETLRPVWPGKNCVTKLSKALSAAVLPESVVARIETAASTIGKIESNPKNAIAAALSGH